MTVLRELGPALVFSREAGEPGASPLAPGALLALLQLSSPGLPIGAFAYSQGLEPAVERGLIRDAAGAEAWLSGVLDEGLARLDLPVLARLHAAFAGGDLDAALGWAKWLVACRETRERRLEDQQLGRALARLLADRGVELATTLLEREVTPHAALFALGAVSQGVPVEPTVNAFAFAWAESQVSVLARLVPLGQLAAQRVLTALAAVIPRATSFALSLPDGELGATLPGLAMLSALHETQYTRLFKS